MVMLGLALTTCNGDKDDDAVAAVKGMFKELERNRVDKVTDFACPAIRDNINKLFGLDQYLTEIMDPAIRMELSDIDPQRYIDLLIFDPSLEYNEVSKNTGEAVVHVKGRLKVRADEAKYKALMRELLERLNFPYEDQLDDLLDQLYTDFERYLEEELSRNIDVEFVLVKEDDEWLICDWGDQQTDLPK